MCSASQMPKKHVRKAKSRLKQPRVLWRFPALSVSESLWSCAWIQDVAQAQSAAESSLLSIQGIAREILGMKRAEIAALDSLGKNSNEQSKKTLQTEASKILTDLYVKAQKSLEEVQNQVCLAHQSADEISQNSKDIESMIIVGDIHSESRQTITTSCKQCPLT